MKMSAIEVKDMKRILPTVWLKELVLHAMRHRNFELAETVWREADVALEMGEMWAAVCEVKGETTLKEEERSRVLEMMNRRKLERLTVHEFNDLFVSVKRVSSNDWFLTAVEAREGMEAIESLAIRRYVSWLSSSRSGGSCAIGVRILDKMSVAAIEGATRENLSRSFEKLEWVVANEEGVDELRWVNAVKRVLLEEWQKGMSESQSGRLHRKMGELEAYVLRAGVVEGKKRSRAL
jgi:hypothetical protein